MRSHSSAASVHQMPAQEENKPGHKLQTRKEEPMTLSEVMMEEAKKMGFSEGMVQSSELYARASNPKSPGGNRDRQLTEQEEQLVRALMQLHLSHGMDNLEELNKAAKQVKRNIQNN